jgi:RNA polymerase sigma factor (sigma-70 family)
MSVNEGPDAERRNRALALAGELYPANQRRLLAIATRNSPTPQDAEEALHDAFALFIQNFDPDSDAPPVAWLTLTLKRRCWAAARHQLPLQPNDQDTLSGPPNHQTPTDELVELAHEATLIRRAFQTLKPQERRALSLLALGYTYRDIADLTGWTYTKVNRCITEGRAALRSHQT